MRASVEALQAEGEEMRRKVDQMQTLKDQLASQLVGKGRISVRDAGVLPTVPIQDDRTAFACMGGGLGSLLGVLLAGLLGRRSRRTA